MLGLALLCSCAREAGLAAPPHALDFPEGGKPRWHGGDDFSVSHAAGYVACALAPPGAAIGLDIELRAAATLDSLRLVTSEDERRLVTSGRLDAAALWTRKEALLKAAGRGVREVAEARAGVDWGTLGPLRCRLLDARLAPGIACAIAVTGEGPALVVRELDGGELLRRGP